MRFTVAISLLLALTACTFASPKSGNEGGLGSSTSSISSITSNSSSSAHLTNSPEVVAQNLTVPWSLAFLPTGTVVRERRASGDMLVTERPGRLLRIGNDRRTYTIEGVRHIGEGGLMGLALHPDFDDNHWLYLYMTTDQGGRISNRVERYTFENDELNERTEILSGIPGSQYHDGGRIAFGPDGYLYITTGDASQEHLAQDTASLAGKILRIEDDGGIPADNPFGNAVYSYGHRNPQGLAWDSLGRLWITEHGRSGIATGYDEVNLIERGANYGWPVIQGDQEREGMRRPFLHSGPTTTWAPASAAIVDDRLFFGGLRGAALYEMQIPHSTADQPALKTHFKNSFGRIRSVLIHRDNSIYVTTSNRDGRGRASASDDRIIRIDADQLR